MLCAGLLLALVLKCGERLAPGTVLRARSFWCPFRARNVRVEFEETAWWDGRRVDVCRCSALTPETAVDCRPTFAFVFMTAIRSNEAAAREERETMTLLSTA